MPNDAKTFTVPLWAIADVLPQSVRIVHRLCWILAVLALFGVIMPLLKSTWGYDFSMPDTSATVVIARTGAAALCAAIVARSGRHILWFVALLIMPIVYFAILPSWRWFLLVPVLILALPYYRYLFSRGTLAWHQPTRTLEKIFSGPAS